MKRFSVAGFILGVVVHFLVTCQLVGLLISASYAMERGEPHHNSLWLALTWIWAPIPMLLALYLRPLSAIDIWTVALPWSVFVAVCFGLLVPRLGRWRRRTV